MENIIEEEKQEILEEFAEKLLSNIVDIDPEIQQMLDEHFWEIYEAF